MPKDDLGRQKYFREAAKKIGSDAVTSLRKLRNYMRKGQWDKAEHWAQMLLQDASDVRRTLRRSIR